MTTTDIALPSLSARQLLRMLSRRKYVAIFVYALIVMLASAYCFFWPPSYAAGVSFLIKRDLEQPIVSADEHSVRTMTRQTLTEEELNDEVELIQSGPVLEATVRDLKLDQIPEHWALRLLNEPIRFATSVYNNYHGKPAESSEQSAVDHLSRKLKVTPGKKSDLLELQLLWGDPDFAKRIIDRIAAHYGEVHQQMHAPPDTLHLYESQLTSAKNDLSDLEAEIESVHPGALLGGLQTEKDLSLHQAADFEAEWKKAQARKSELDARVAGRTQDLAAEPTRVVSDDKAANNQLALGNLKTQVMDLELKKSQLLAKYKPENFLVQQASQDLEKAREMLIEERADVYHEKTTTTNRVAEALKEDLALQRGEGASAGALARALQKDAGTYASRLQQLDRDAAKVQDLELRRKTLQDQVLQYSQRYEEAHMQNLMNKSQFVNVAQTGPAWAFYSPAKPNTPLMLKLAVGLGLLVSCGFALALDLWYGRIYEPFDIRGAFDAPFIGAIENYEPMSGTSWTSL